MEKHVHETTFWATQFADGWPWFAQALNDRNGYDYPPVVFDRTTHSRPLNYLSDADKARIIELQTRGDVPYLKQNSDGTFQLQKR